MPHVPKGAVVRLCAVLAACAVTAGLQPGAFGTSIAGTVGTRGDESGPALRGLLVFSRQVCDSDTDPCWEIVVSDAHENHARVVAGPYPRGVWDDHFVANWAPDGRSVIFMADLGEGQSIYRVRSDGSHLHAIFTAPDGTGLDDGPAFTPDGRHIVFTRCCPEVSGYALWSITPAGHHVRQVTSEAVPPGADGPSDNLPQVSPDGRTVAYHRNNVIDPSMGIPGANRIAVAPLPAGRHTDLTDPRVLDAQIPNWTPDGSQIAFQSLAGGDVLSIDIWRVNRDGTGLTRLTTDGASLNPSYTPDGDLLFSRIRDDGGRDLFVAQPDGSGPRLIKATDGIERFPHLIRTENDDHD